MKERIKEIREKLGLTQQEFADNLNLKRQTIASYESGNIRPGNSTLLLICQVFGINKDWLENGFGEMYIKRTKNQEISAFMNNAMRLPDEIFQKRFIAALCKLDSKDWEEIERIARKLTEEG